MGTDGAGRLVVSCLERPSNNLSSSSSVFEGNLSVTPEAPSSELGECDGSSCDSVKLAKGIHSALAAACFFPKMLANSCRVGRLSKHARQWKTGVRAFRGLYLILGCCPATDAGGSSGWVREKAVRASARLAAWPSGNNEKSGQSIEDRIGVLVSSLADRR